MRDFFKKASNIIAPFLIFVSYLIIYPMIISLMIMYLNITSMQNKMLIILLISIMFIIFYLIIFRKNLIEDFKIFKHNLKSSLKIGLKYWVSGIIMMMIFNLIAYSISPDLSQNEEANRELLLNFPLIQSFTILIFAPICEEIVFRLNFRKSIKNNFIFCLISGLLFGSIHMIGGINGLVDIYHLLAYTSLGVAFAASLVKTKSIFTPMSFHLLHNLIGVIVILVR